LGRDEKKHFPFQNSWGLSTRLIGGLVMTHSDNSGLVLPPNVAENKVVIIPLIFKDKKEKVIKKSHEVYKKLKKFGPILDDSEDYSPGYKFSEYELKGIPLRIEIGPRDLENESVTLVRRDTKEKTQVKSKNIVKEVSKILKNMQNEMFEKAKKRMESSIVNVNSKEEFEKAIKNKKLIKMGWCGETSCEENIKEETGATTRCVLLKKEKPLGKCPFCSKKAKEVMYFSKSY
jgi:prolyl-tRNA synthetase